MYYQSLVSCIEQIGYLYLPGVGVLNLVKKSASLDRNSNNIRSPRFSLVLDDSKIVEQDDQIQFLEEQWNTERIRAKAAIQRIASEITTVCANQRIFHLPGLGEFQSNENEITFCSSGELEKIYNYFNRSYQLNRAYKPVIAVEKIESTKIVQKENETRTIRSFYYKMAAACFIVMLIALVGTRFINEGNQNLLSPVKYNLDSTEYSEDQINRAPETDGSDLNMDKVLTSEELVNLDSVSELENLDQGDSVKEPEALINQITDTSEDETKLKIGAFEIEEKEEQCIYILGSYASDSNAQKMIKIIDKKDLELYKAAYKGNTRIGVVVSCSDDRAIEQLKSIEKNYWLLK